MNNLLIIDGSALLSTSYYGNLPPEIKFLKDKSQESLYWDKILHSPSGMYTNGIYSFMVKLEKILKEQKPTHIAITFDMTRDTFRRKLYPEYKANRSETPQPLKMQRDFLPQMLTDMGIKTFWHPNFEGDDIIGSLVDKFSNEINISILSGDHDMMQLIRPGVQLWYMTHSIQKAKEKYYQYTQGNTDFTLESLNLPEGVFPYGKDSTKWEMGVYPEQIADLKGLSGDSSDNIPGVKGISEKTASILLSEYGTVEKLFNYIENHSDEEIKKEWKEKLGINRPPVKAIKADKAKESAILCKKLATIITGLKIELPLDDFLITNIKNDIKHNYYNQLSFKSLLRETL